MAMHCWEGKHGNALLGRQAPAWNTLLGRRGPTACGKRVTSVRRMGREGSRNHLQGGSSRQTRF